MCARTFLRGQKVLSRFSITNELLVFMIMFREQTNRERHERHERRERHTVITGTAVSCMMLWSCRCRQSWGYCWWCIYINIYNYKQFYDPQLCCILCLNFMRRCEWAEFNVSLDSSTASKMPTTTLVIKMDDRSWLACQSINVQVQVST